MAELWAVFLTGLLSGGLTCAAVQGGLLATATAKGNRVLGTAAFTAAKLAAYVVLGAGLGWLGSRLAFSPVILGVFQGIAAVYMIVVGLTMLDVHPWLRRLVITPPRWAYRWSKSAAGSDSWLAPVVLGGLTVFLPCGTTLAVMALAAGSANSVTGALIMGAFVLGTTPVFWGLGMAISAMGKLLKDRFMKVLGVVTCLLGLWAANGALVVSGAPISAGRVVAAVECALSYCAPVSSASPSDEVTIVFSDRGYEVDNSVVRAGAKVRLNLVNRSGAGCVQAFTMPAVNLQRVVSLGSAETVEIQVPDKPGELPFSCSMGMYQGKLLVI